MPAHGQPTARRPRPVPIVTAVLAVAGAVQVALGLYWWLGNQVAVPEYGDTTEYLAQAQSFALDGYRTLAYPLLVRGALELGALLHVPWTVLLYQVQLAAWAAAAWYLVRTVAPRGARLRVLACTAVVVTVPLPLHYAAVVLTDSLALSTSVVVVSAVARIAARDRLDLRTLTVLVLGVAAAVFVRPDRLYVTVAIAAGAALVVALRTRRRARVRLTGRRALLVAGVLLAAVALPGLATTALNRSTQTADLGRSTPTPVGALFQRVAGLHVEEIRDLVPPDVAAAFPPPGADRWAVASALSAAGGDAYLLAGVRATLDCCAGAVVSQSARDVAHGVGGPYQIASDWVTGSNGSSNWDFTRMAQHRPHASAAVMAWSVASAVVLAAASVTAVLEVRRRRDDPGVAGVTAVLVGSCVVVAAFFGLTTSSIPNPRYTLISQAVAWALPLGVLLAPAPGRRAAGDEPAGDDAPEAAVPA
ncbi:hypothetical protein [Cellulomonas sp.]|uniref:hypothetical protein n=1 Tax=Cellulomonas sp. TaxID=40001 RepID=UPI002D426D74|nr:hypothetical protein [Cellulomonas sp.]HYQ74705.1 hypothetical protein [Cellulomonas sp.]